MNYKRKLVTHLNNNEEVIQIVSVEDLEKEYQELKKNVKTVALATAPVKDSVDATRLVKAFGIRPNKVIMKSYNGKRYVILKGYPGDRTLLKGTKYLASNPKVVRMAIGPKGIINSAKMGFVITAVLSVSIEVYNYLLKDSVTLSQLLGTITGDLIKIGITSIVAAIAGIAAGTVAVIGTSVAAPFIIAIAVGIVIGYVLDKIDDKIGATHALIQAYSKIGIELHKIEYEFSRNMKRLEKDPQLITCFFRSCPIRGY